ncbi:MAG: M56 family metallopeptidase, partial [Maribacter sp.]
MLSGILLSTALPLIYFNKEVVVTNFPILNTTEYLSETKILATPETHWFLNILGTFYLIGTLFLFFKLILQLKRLKQFLNQKNNPSPLKTNHIISDENIQPFSFFQWIIYNPQLHSKPALEAIIAHEQVHATQLHSLDILLTELFCILQWFNPVVWFYRTSIKQNLEFLADAHNNHIKTNKKEYQY